MRIDTWLKAIVTLVEERQLLLDRIKDDTSDLELSEDLETRIFAQEPFDVDDDQQKMKNSVLVHAWAVLYRDPTSCCRRYWAGNGWSFSKRDSIRFARKEDAIKIISLLSSFSECEQPDSMIYSELINFDD